MIKQNIDHDIKLEIKFKDLNDHVSIVTGGNSGTGLAIAKQLVSLGSTVVIGCRSAERCNNAATEISDLYPTKKHLIIPMYVDLNDLTSVKNFSKEFMKKLKRLDILINNAGLMTDPGALTAQGLEQAFGTMHIGHFALTKYLLKLLLKPLPGKRLFDAARVINIASDAAFLGNFHPSLMSGSGEGDLATEVTDNCGKIGSVDCCPLLACPNTNGYARAKLANVLHAYELQRRVDEYILHNSGGSGPSKNYRRLVTASLHPGSVSTNINDLSRLLSFFLRTSDQAAHIILHAVLDDSFIPGSYLDGMRRPHDLFGHQEHHLSKHFAAFPAVKNLPFGTAKSADNRFSLHRFVWDRQPLIVPTEIPSLGKSKRDAAGNLGTVVDTSLPGFYRKDTVAARLWDVSDQIVKDWEAKKPILKTSVPTTLSSKLTL